MAEIRHHYALIGGCSPLLERTQAQAAALQASLGEAYRVYIGMRHWHPYIKETVSHIAADGVGRVRDLARALPDQRERPNQE